MSIASNKLFVEQLRYVDGRRLQEGAAAAALDPIDVALVAGLHPELEALRAFRARGHQRKGFFGGGLHQLQLQSDDFQRGQHVAIRFFVLFRKASWERKPVRPSVAPKSPKNCAERIAQSDQDAIQFLRSRTVLRCASAATSRVRSSICAARDR